MKRKLWIIPVLVLLLAALWCAAAQAEDALSFVQQPTVGELDTDTLYYRVDWELGFKPVRSEIRYRESAGDAWQYFRTVYYARRSDYENFGPSTWGKEYRIRAYYRYDEEHPENNRYVDSTAFTFPGASDPALSFVQQPTVGELDTDTLYYRVDWELGFKPVRTEIQCRESAGDAWQYFRNVYYVRQTDYENFGPSTWGKEYRIRAYYRYDEDHPENNRYVDSLPFSLKIHTVTFDANGASGGMSEAVIVGDDPFTLPACGFTWTGHVFDKWQIGADYYQPGDTVTLTEEFTTVRAIWKTLYTITFNANGGSGSMASVTVPEGAYVLPENGFTGSSSAPYFSYWRVSSEPGALKCPGWTIQVRQNITVSAIWSTGYKVTFNMQGYGTQIAPVYVKPGGRLTRPADPVANGMHFVTWALGPEQYASVYNFDRAVTGPLTLYARWTPDTEYGISLTFDPYQGNVTLDKYTAREGEWVYATVTPAAHYRFARLFYNNTQTESKSFKMPACDVDVSVHFSCDHVHDYTTLTNYPEVAATCENEGHIRYLICPTCGLWFYYIPWGSNYTLEYIPDQDPSFVVTEALGHDYGDPVYEWSADYGSVTATSVCSRDEDHVLTETAFASAVVTREPGPFTRGEHTYTAVFTNPFFTTQTFVLDDIEPLGIPVTAQFFPDDYLRSWVGTRVDTDSNGYLTDAERSGHGWFDGFNGKGITSLEGIEYFPDTVRLIAANNPGLTEADLSLNAKLATLNLGNCGLTGLNISGCAKLYTLQLYGNPLTELDLGSKPSLIQVDVKNCANLSELSLSGCPNLLFLSTYGSGVTELNIRNNPYLKEACATVNESTAEYDYYGDDDQYLKVNPGTIIRDGDGILINAAAFPDSAFRAYVNNCIDTDGDGWLSVVEMGDTDEILMENASTLADMRGIEYFPNLVYLVVGHQANLTAVDLSANKAVRSIDIYDTGLTALDVSGLSLRYLYVSSSPVSELTLGEQPNLEILSCFGTDFTTLNIENCPHIVEAYLTGARDDSDPRFVTWLTDMYYALEVGRDIKVYAGPVEMNEPDFTLPANLGVIEDEAFAGIAAHTVRIPDNVTHIGANVFDGCTELHQVYIPAGANLIDPDVFAGAPEDLMIFGTPGTRAEEIADAYGFRFFEA